MWRGVASHGRRRTKDIRLRDTLALRAVLVAAALGVIGIGACLAFPPWVALVKSNGQWHEVDRLPFHLVGRVPTRPTGVTWTIDPPRYRRRVAVSLVLAIMAPGAALLLVRRLTSTEGTARSVPPDEV